MNLAIQETVLFWLFASSCCDLSATESDTESLKVGKVIASIRATPTPSQLDF